MGYTVHVLTSKDNSTTHLFDAELLSCNLSHLGDSLSVVLKTHFQTLGECEGGFGLNYYPQLF